jgi:hypothetical protein
MYFILAKRADIVFRNGTAEVNRHRRRYLRAGRLPLRLFDTDRNDDSQLVEKV